MELMTLGVNKFTEDDVKAAARPDGLLHKPSHGSSRLRPDPALRQAVTILGTTAKLDAESLVALIVAKQENAKFIAERMWFRFVSGSSAPPPSIAGSFASRDIPSLVSALVYSSAWTSPLTPW